MDGSGSRNECLVEQEEVLELKPGVWAEISQVKEWRGASQRERIASMSGLKGLCAFEGQSEHSGQGKSQCCQSSAQIFSLLRNFS